MIQDEKRDGYQKRKTSGPYRLLTGYPRLVFVWSMVLVLQDKYGVRGEYH